MNVMMLLEMAASGFGDRTALGSRDGSGLTYTELFRRAGAAAAHFADSDAERVALIDISSPALPVALFGSAWAGKPFVPLNYRLTAEELRSLGGQVAPAVAIVNVDTSATVGEIEGVLHLQREDFLGSVTDADAPEPSWNMDPDEIAILLFTSGTTGAPKAAVLRHKHLVSYILGSVEFMGAGEDEATLVSVPPYHIAGMAALCSSVYAGRRIVQLANFDADAWIDLARAEEITHAMVVPTMLARIVDRLQERGEGGVPTLRALSYGGGKMPGPVIARALDLMPDTAFVNAYGLTETSSTIAVLGPDDHREAHGSDDPAVRARLGSVGRPLPTLEVEIRDEEGQPVPAGASGEIWVRGEQVSGEYLGRDSRLTAEGWLPTNDGGSIDEAGYLYVEGRIDDIIIRGGENISPGEIEDVLLGLDEIADVAALGVPDEQWGEVIAVAIVPKEGSTIDADTLRTHVKERLRSSRTPDHVVVMDELPYNETGKLLRRVLREQFADLNE
jgi:acyl-CoA synthetase (AMP-forming)/AMP-acid ligase II